jgi:hypothetical protein
VPNTNVSGFGFGLRFLDSSIFKLAAWSDDEGWKWWRDVVEVVCKVVVAVACSHIDL